MSAVLGSQFYKWYASTKIGIYFQNRLDQFMEYISQKYDIEIMKKQSKFEQDYPLMMKRIEEIIKLNRILIKMIKSEIFILKFIGR